MGFGVWGLGFGVWGLGFGVWGLGFGVWGLGFGVWGLGLGFRRAIGNEDCSRSLVRQPQLLIERAFGDGVRKEK